MNTNGELQSLATSWAKLIYKIVQVLHDFAYFGFITIQPLVINKILENAVGIDNKIFGLTPFAVTVLIISLHLIFQVLLEVPSGAWADNRGRMATVRNSFVVRVFAVLLLGLAFYITIRSKPSPDNPYLLLVIGLLVGVEVLMATAEALYTGSIEAWLVDTLKYCGGEDEVGDAFSSSAIQQNVAIMVAMPLFLFLNFYVQDSNGANVLFSVIAISLIFISAGVLAHSNRGEVYRQTTDWLDREKATISSTLIECWQLIRSQRIILWWLLLIAAPFGAWVVVSWMWPLLQKAAFFSQIDEAKKVSEQTVNFVLILFGLLMALARVGGSWLSRAIQRFANPFKGLRLALLSNLVVLSGGAVYLSISNYELSWVVNGNVVPDIPIVALVFSVTLIVSKALEEVVKIFSQIVLARVISDSTIRATAISFSSLISNLFAFLVILGAVVVSSNVEKESSRVGLIVLVVAVFGLVLGIVASFRLSQLISFPKIESAFEEVSTESNSVDKSQDGSLRGQL